MPTWLPGVITAVVLGLIGNYISIVVMVQLNRQSMTEHARRLLIVEEDKLDLALHLAEVRRINERLEAVDKGIQSAGHRMNGLDQRITSEVENVRGAT